MVLPWRRIRLARRSNKKHEAEDMDSVELTIPSHFNCPISLDMMKDPVTVSTGMTYDRQSIETWIESGSRTCPITTKPLTTLEPIPNHTIRKMIQEWCVENRSHGVERIPTPRIPVSSYQVSEILSKLADARRVQDDKRCLDLVAKVKALVKESDRNKRCFMANRAGVALSATYKALSEGPFDSRSTILGDILSILTLMLPLDEESKSSLGSSSSLNSMVWLLKYGDLSGRSNVVLVLKEIVSSDQKKVDALVEITGAMEGLIKVLKEPISPTTTKASLMAIYSIISSSSSKDKIISRFVEMGLVHMVLEMLVDSGRSICEKGLGVLDQLCNLEEGSEKACSNALTMPILVKKILRVSELATEFSVSILWKLSKYDQKNEGGVLFEALQVGAFQKLLLLLQVGCGEKTKERAGELLKMMNLYRARLECVDSMDFKDLKRPF